jgi:hypothetical protein
MAAKRRLAPPDGSKGDITFGEIAETLSMLNVVCDRCGRRGRYRLDKLIAKYGAGSHVQPLQEDLTKDCPEKHDPDTHSASARR